MSDELYSRAVRYALSNGEELELARILVSQMDTSMRGAIIRYAGFLTRRMTKTWTLGEVKIPIAQLPDTAIERIVNSARCKRVFEDLEDRYSWARDRAYESAYYIILQEAEHRNIPIQQDQGRVLRELLGDCLDTRHNINYAAGVHTCSNCQKRVTDALLREALPKITKLL